MEMKACFLQTSSAWLRDLTTDNMSNWSRISLLTTEIILNTMAHRQDDPITYGNCIHVLCLLSSDERTGSRIRDLGGRDKIMNLCEDCFCYCSERNNVIVLFGTLKVQSFILTEVSDCGLLIVVTSSTFLKRKDMLKEKSS